MLEKKHLQEWINSAVDPQLTELNVVSLANFEPYERLLYALPEKERRNDGRIRDKLLKRYSHLEKGGWWVSGIDILTGEDSQWGQFKPDIPYKYQKGFDSSSKAKNKLVKYEPPKDVPTEIFALKVNFYQSWNIVKRINHEEAKIAWIQRFWEASSNQIQSSQPSDIKELQEACERREYGEIERILQTVWNRSPDSSKQFDQSDSRGIENLIKAVDRGFWLWVKATPQIPVTITEGAKKAGSILTAGAVAIALPGIYNGYRQRHDRYGHKIGFPSLIPQLKAFAHQDREIIFCFDRDPKATTIKNVKISIAKTGRLFEREGCKVSVITWKYAEKGVDDLIAARGQDCFHQLYRDRQPLSNFKLLELLDLSKYQPLKVNQRYLSDNLVPPADAQIIGLKSPKGSNKTGWLAKVVAKATREGKPVLVITHRIQLAKALCVRFGIDHIEEVRNSQTRGVLGYGLCIDSLHPNSQAHFNPEDWNEAVVILDEAEQVLWHLLDSSTCQDNRVAIVENFQQLLKIAIGTGGKIYLSDADLSPIAIDYVQKLIAVPVKTWVVENIYQSNHKRQLISYSGGDPRELISALVKAIEQGNKVLIHTTGQKARSKWGSINLESLLKQKFPLQRILRIDRDSVSEPKHPAYGCMSNLNNILKNYDIAIASPVIETGVSIDLKGHFDSVWAIAQGLQTVDAVCQTVARLRDNVPRHIWIKTTAKGNRIGNGSTSVKALLRSQHKLTKANILLLQQASISDFEDLDVDFSPHSLLAWSKRACVVNAGKNNYREAILSKLLSEGYDLDHSLAQDPENTQIIKQEVKQICQANYHKYCQAVSSSALPCNSELEKLANQRAKTEEERLTERKGILSKRYGIEVTPELVEKDDRGWYSKLQLHYYLAMGNAYLAEKDRRSLSRIKEQGNGKAFKPDIGKRQLSATVRALQLINIEQFLAPEAEFTKESLQDWLDLLIQLRFDIKTILGVTIHPEKDSAIAVAQRILNKLGTKLNFKHQIRINGKPTRIYQGCDSNLDGRLAVFDYWLEREQDDCEPYLLAS